MGGNSGEEGHQHKQKGWEHICTVLVLAAEYLAVRYSMVWLAWTAALFLWFAVMNYARHYFRPRPAKIVILVAMPIIIASTYYLIRGKKVDGSEGSTVQAQTAPPQQPSSSPSQGPQRQIKPGSKQQAVSTRSKGDNSPAGAVNQEGNNNNAVIGNNNNVSIGSNADEIAAKVAQMLGPTINGGFREVVTEIRVSLGSVTTVLSVEAARSGAVPFVIGDGDPPVRIRFQGDQILFSFESWAGVPIAVNDNEVKIGNADVDRNFGENAFEIVDKQGDPIFQMIRKNAASMEINGIFPTGNISQRTGKPIFLWVSKETGIESNSIRPANWNLKPIFKYPSWRNKGVYAFAVAVAPQLPVYNAKNPIGSIVNQNSPNYGTQTVNNVPPSRLLDDEHAAEFQSVFASSGGAVAVFPAGTDLDVIPLAKQICDLIKDTKRWSLNCVGVPGYATQIPVDLPSKLLGLHCYRATEDVRKAFRDSKLGCVYENGPFVSGGVTLGFLTIVIGNAEKR